MSANHTTALATIIEAIMFENWLRFYFIDETGAEDLTISIPDKGFAQIQKLYPHLAPLATSLNNRPITHESSMQAVCLFIAATLDGKKIPDHIIEDIFGSPAFQTEIQLFGTWVQSHETQLDQKFFPFNEWQSFFKEWRASEKVQEHIDEINETLSHTATTGSKEIQ